MTRETRDPIPPIPNEGGQRIGSNVPESVLDGIRRFTGSTEGRPPSFILASRTFLAENRDRFSDINRDLIPQETSGRTWQGLSDSQKREIWGAAARLVALSEQNIGELPRDTQAPGRTGPSAPPAPAPLDVTESRRGVRESVADARVRAAVRIREGLERTLGNFSLERAARNKAARATASAVILGAALFGSFKLGEQNADVAQSSAPEPVAAANIGAFQEALDQAIVTIEKSIDQGVSRIESATGESAERIEEATEAAIEAIGEAQDTQVEPQVSLNEDDYRDLYQAVLEDNPDFEGRDPNLVYEGEHFAVGENTREAMIEKGVDADVAEKINELVIEEGNGISQQLKKAIEESSGNQGISFEIDSYDEFESGSGSNLALTIGGGFDVEEFSLNGNNVVIGGVNGDGESVSLSGVVDADEAKDLVGQEGLRIEPTAVPNQVRLVSAANGRSINISFTSGNAGLGSGTDGQEGDLPLATPTPNVSPSPTVVNPTPGPNEGDLPNTGGPLPGDNEGDLPNAGGPQPGEDEGDLPVGDPVQPGEPTPAPTPTPKPHQTPAPTPTPRPHPTPAPTPTPKPHVTVTPTPTPTELPTPAPTPTPKPHMTPTPTPTPTESPTPTPTQPPEQPPEEEETPTPTPTPPIETPTPTPTPTVTPTPTPTPSETPVPTPTPEKPQPPMTGAFNAGDRLGLFENRTADIELEGESKIEAFRIMRGDEVIVETDDVGIAKYGIVSGVMRGQNYSGVETWNVPSGGRFSQLVGGGISFSDEQQILSIHVRETEGENAIGAVPLAQDLLNVKVGDTFVDENGQTRVVTFVGETDPRLFFNANKNSVILMTCSDDSDTNNPERFVVVAESAETRGVQEAVEIAKVEVPIPTISDRGYDDQVAFVLAQLKKEEDEEEAKTWFDFIFSKYALAALASGIVTGASGLGYSAYSIYDRRKRNLKKITERG